MKSRYFVLSLLLSACFTFAACGDDSRIGQNKDSLSPYSTATATATATATVTATDPALPPQSFTRLPADIHFIAPTEVVSSFGPDCIIRDVIVDRNGIIWMATWQGIVKYNGKEFTNMTLQAGLPHHRIYSLYEDSKGILWFGSMGAGVFRYDGTHFSNLNENHGLANNNVISITEDFGGGIWFGTDSGASRYDGSLFGNVTLHDSLQGSVQAIAQDHTGAMWFGTSKGLYLYSTVETAHGGRGMRLTPLLTVFGTPYSNVRDLEFDDNNIMWMAAARGLYNFTVRPHVEPKVTQINEKFHGYVNPDRHGNLLLTSDGIFRFDGKQSDTIVSDVSNLGVFGATEDAQGIVWYGAMDGLHRYDGSSNITLTKRGTSQ